MQKEKGRRSRQRGESERQHEFGSVFAVPFCLCLDGQQINVSSKKLTIINTSKVTTEPVAEGGGRSGNGSTAGAVGEGQRDLLRSRKSARNYSRSIKSINKQRTNSEEREREGEIAAEEARQQLPQGHWGSVGEAEQCRGEGHFKSKVKSLCTARSTHKLKNKGNWTRIGTHQTTATDATLAREREKEGDQGSRGDYQWCVKLVTFAAKWTQQTGNKQQQQQEVATLTLNRRVMRSGQRGGKNVPTASGRCRQLCEQFDKCAGLR